VQGDIITYMVWRGRVRFAWLDEAAQASIGGARYGECGKASKGLAVKVRYGPVWMGASG